MAREDTRGKARGVSLDDDDAIDVGLFGPGPARIAESIFTHYDYNGTSRKPPLVWLLTLERGTGKERETYEQPYTIGKGWDVSKDGKELIPKNGQTGLPKSCNAILYLIKPLKKALKAAKLELDLTTGDPSVLEGMEVVLDRIDQESRDIKDRDGDRDRGRARDRDQGEKRGPSTILVIDEVTELPGDEKPKAKAKGRAARDEDDEDETPKSRHKKPAPVDDDEDEDEPPAKAKGKGRAAKDEDDESDDDTTEEDAIEAVVSQVEKGAVKLADLENLLARALKKNKNMNAIIDLATSKAFLKTERGWTFDGKVIDAPEEEEAEEEEPPTRKRR